MLRKVVLGFAILMLGGGVLLLFAQPENAFPLLMFGVLLTLGTVFERWRYKQPKTAATARGSATGERFVDPETGALMEVWYDAATGERSYVKLADKA
ncbi:MAG TPA: hypothetical protein VLV87_07875 [Gammaproteobacteria bacterium]|nr:hypothetical protein [Gammaproteobacteria bacterium]